MGEFRDRNRERGRPKNSWKEAMSRDSAKFGFNDWQRTGWSRINYFIRLNLGYEIIHEMYCKNAFYVRYQ
jgi:hypothetical protein